MNQYSGIILLMTSSKPWRTHEKARRNPQGIREKAEADVGKLALVGLKALCQVEDIELIGKEEINAEYMSGVINSWQANNRP